MFFLWISKRRGDKMKDYIFTSESVTEGHPDKICDVKELRRCAFLNIRWRHSNKSLFIIPLFLR